MGNPQPSIEAKLLEGLVGMAVVAVEAAAVVHLECLPEWTYLPTYPWLSTYLPLSNYLPFSTYLKPSILKKMFFLLSTYLTVTFKKCTYFYVPKRIPNYLLSPNIFYLPNYKLLSITKKIFFRLFFLPTYL